MTIYETGEAQDISNTRKPKTAKSNEILHLRIGFQQSLQSCNRNGS